MNRALLAVIACCGLLLLRPTLIPAQNPVDLVVPVTVTTSSSPRFIQLSFPATTNAVSTLVGKKLLYGGSWSYAALPAGTTSVIDTSVTIGVGYEYIVIKQTSTAPTSRFGLVYAGIELPAQIYRGKIVLIVDDALASPLATELSRFAQDLRGDGWQVQRHDINTGSSTVKSVKSLLLNDYVADPNTVAALLIGNIPVPYSGELNPDGHPDHIGAWPTDYYYSDLDESDWTDNTVNNATATRAANRNVPGDGKFDQSFMPGFPELVVTRVDFSNLSGWSVSQTELYRRYFNKNHAFRTGAYVPSDKTLVDDNFGYMSGEAFAQSGIRSGYALTGTASVISGDFFTDSKTQNFLVGYGCGGGNYNGASGVGSSDNFKTDSVNVTFSMLFGSYFGDWDYETNPFMPSALASKGGILTCGWAGRPNWYMHHMALGEPIMTTLLWTWINGLLTTPVYPNTHPNQDVFRRMIHIGMLGDPTLRAHNMKPPTNVTAVATACTRVDLSWTASPDADFGYLVYRAPSLDSIFELISPDLVAGTMFTDSFPLPGQNYYQVRAFKLQNATTGSYYNQSLGAPASVNLLAGPAVSASATPTTCNGGSNGTVNLSIPGGVSYTYLWSNGATTQNLSNVPAGAYTVTVSNTAGCTSTASATVTQPPALVLSATQTNVTCFGADNGTITLTVSGGTGGRAYLWSNNASTQNNAALAPGVYTVTVTDALGCSKTTSATITGPTALSLALAPAKVTCNGIPNGSIVATVSGGTPAYTYKWSNGATTPNLSNIGAGTYTLTITDTNGCTKTAVATVQQPTALISSANTTSAGCAGATNGSVTLTVSGGTPGYTFLWSNNATTQNLAAVGAGTYTVTITDAAGCTKTNTATVQQITTLAAQATATDITCFGAANGSALVQASGGAPGYSYLWSTGATTAAVNNLVPGTYTVTVTDVAGCSQSTSVAVAQPSAPLSAATQFVQTSCPGVMPVAGNASSTVQGGTQPYTYLWSNGSITPNLTNVPLSQYQLTVTDAKSCTMVQANIQITQIPTWSVAPAVTNVSCFGGSNGKISLSVSGATGPNYSYKWSNGATTKDLQNVPAGAYTVTVTDSKNCTTSTVVQVDQPAAVVVAQNAAAGKAITCHGGNDGALAITSTGGTPGYSYFWSNGGNTSVISGLSSGVYGVTVLDAKGCTGTLTNITLTDPTAVVGVAKADNLSVCYGHETTLHVQSITGGNGAPYKYSVDFGVLLDPALPFALGAGTHTITYYDRLNCEANETLIIQRLGPSNASIAGNDTACVNIGTLYNLPGNFSGYQWVASNNGSITNGQGTAAVTAVWPKPGAQTLSVFFINNFNCPDTAVFQLVADICVGTSEAALPGVQIQPNPFGDWLLVVFEQAPPAGEFRLRLTDIQGRVVVEQQAQSAQTRLETGHLPAGTYLLYVEDAGRMGVWKVVKMGN